MMDKSYVYIAADNASRLCVGIYAPKIEEKKAEKIFKESAEVSLNKKLLYYEIYLDQNDAEIRAHQIKEWPENKKKFLINFVNPSWDDWSSQLQEKS
jgi:predicted GIY-YIG superfamily endonuclease